MTIDITIKRISIPLDPSGTLFHVTAETENGMWAETFGSKEALRAFLLGIQAGASFFGKLITTPEIPREAESEIPPEWTRRSFT